MTINAITVNRLGKRYRIARERATYGRLTESLASSVRTPIDRLRGRMQQESESFWALRDISFEVPAGQVLGVIGRNGAGKSTLLKILSRITEPTTGRAELFGRVGSLLEVGTGFHPELTGRENILLSGSILGMRRSEIERRFDEIVEFSGLAQFLDVPIKRYSSGMSVRLGFAVAAHLSPDILLLDEVLAVGDASFQQKSLARISEIAAAGRTVLFVSHDLGAISRMTERCAYLEAGKVHRLGPTSEVVREYLADSLEPGQTGTDIARYRRPRSADSPVLISAISLKADEASSTLPLGDPIAIEISVDVLAAIDSIGLTVILRNEQGLAVAVLYSRDSDFTLTSGPRALNVLLRVDDLHLTPGRYYADIGLNQSASTVAHEVLLDYPILEVQNTGQVVEWLNRPWGVLHPTGVTWEIVA
jgi:lipopolysaccharide transport system ATP-binding protein